MTRVIENAGGVVTHFSGLTSKVDAFSMHRKRPIFIRNLAKESVCRQRFDLAHECGHIVMHTGITTGDDITELEANRFASAFLLPRSAFLTDFNNALKNNRFSWSHIYEMKLRWKVSVAAIIRRAYDLKLIDAVQYRYTNVYLRKSGQARTEQFDPDIPTENPELISEAINFIKSDAPELQNWIISEMAVTPKLFEKLLPEGTPKILWYDTGTVIKF